VLSAAGVSALVAASHQAYEVLRIAGAGFLVWLGLRALLARGAPDPARAAPAAAWRAARKGLVNSLANPKLAVFFVSLFPQFLTPGTAVLPAAVAMAAVIIALDVLWYGAVAVAVDGLRRVLRPRVLRRLEQAGGAVLVAFGLRLATEAR
jgi:threonine/homoserine/homoserine lactone efflux protein